MAVASLSAKDIFLQVAELPTSERDAFLEAACSRDAALRRRVEALLLAHERPEALLDQPAAEPLPAGGAGPTFAGLGQPKPGTLIAGRYKLLELIGEGGMGTVWVAEQSEPVRRRVALKLIKPGMDTRHVLSRFEAERQALALMDHPNIARVFDGGMTDDGRPFFVMEYVKGLPITQYCDDARLTVAERLALFTRVCQAVQHAHQKGIIHRDLKPSNILVCLYDGQAVPKVIDFGLAKSLQQSLTEHSLYTAHGSMVGTPLYMSPEQAEFNNLDIDTRSDIYSLGVILYEILTGTTPLERKLFKDAAWQEMVRLIKEEEPPRPSTRLSGSDSLPSVAAQRSLDPAKLARTVRGELDWIVMKALEKERSRRYETAIGLARDLERYLADEPVLACPPSTWYRLKKVARRHAKLLATAAAFVVLLIVGIVISIWQAAEATHAWNQEALQRRTAVAEQRKSKAAEQQALTAGRENRQILARQYVANGARLLEKGNRTEALVWFVEALRTDAADADRDEMHRRRIATVAQLCPRPEQVWPHPGPVTNSFYSPDGKRVITICGPEVRAWDAVSGRLAFPAIQHSASVLHAEFDGQGSRLLTFCAATPAAGSMILVGEARVFDAATGRALTLPLKHDAAGIVRSLPSFSSDGRKVLTLSGQSEGRFEHPITGETIRHFQGGESRVWDAATGKPLTPPLSLEHGINQTRFSPDGSRVYAANEFGQARLWDSESGQAVTDVLTYGVPKPWSISTCSFTADGQQLFILYCSAPFGSGRRTRELDQFAASGWDVDTGKLVGDPRPLAIRLPSGAFRVLATDGLHILVAPSTGPGRMFDASTGDAISAPITLDSGIFPESAWFTDDGKRVLITYRVGKGLQPEMYGEARIWDTATGQPQTPPMMLECPVRGQGPNFSISSLNEQRHSFSADGRKLLLLEGLTTVRVWDATTGRPLTPPIRHEGQELKAVLSPDGRRLLTAAGTDARVWDASSGRPLSPMWRHNGRVIAIAFSPAGSHVLTASQDGTARLWPLTAGEPPLRLLEHDAPVAHAEFSADNKTVTSQTHRVQGSSVPSTAQSWDVVSGQPRGPATEIKAPSVRAVQSPTRILSPDRQWEAQVDGPNLQVIDLAAGRPAGEPIRHPTQINRAGFTPDGRALLTISGGILIDTRMVARAGLPGMVVGQSFALGEFRIWDARTGEPIAPPLPHFDPGHPTFSMALPQLSSDGNCLLLGVDQHTLGIWDLPDPDPRSVAELVKLAQALSGRRFDEAEGIVPVATDEWVRLRAETLDAAPASALDLITWRRREGRTPD